MLPGSPRAPVSTGFLGGPGGSAAKSRRRRTRARASDARSVARRRLRWAVGWGGLLAAAAGDGSRGARDPRAQAAEGPMRAFMRRHSRPRRVCYASETRSRGASARVVVYAPPPPAARFTWRYAWLKRACYFLAQAARCVRANVCVASYSLFAARCGSDRAGFVFCYCAFEFFYSSFQRRDLVRLGRHMWLWSRLFLTSAVAVLERRRQMLCKLPLPQRFCSQAMVWQRLSRAVSSQRRSGCCKAGLC